MIAIDAILARLEGGHRARGPGKWTTACPAHDDREPSLSVEVVQNGSEPQAIFPRNDDGAAGNGTDRHDIAGSDGDYGCDQS